MSAEYWSPAAELTRFMQATQRIGNEIAGNIAMARKFHGEAWAHEQLEQMAANAATNRDALATTYDFLNSHHSVPHVLHEGQLGKWLGIKTAPDNKYSIIARHDGVRRELSLGGIVLVDAITDSTLYPNGPNVFGNGPKQVYLVLGSMLFPQRYPQGSNL